ncbi:MAG: glyoxalase [Rhodospirillaceae bacterium TMED8]|nr:glyoxalase [Magnetovibrio sp.]OUT51134.1 MAG: glyoxalase [Rhodospirillaceae bacterium TMED8]|tara:strand:- start:614 stop:922 length:309 start_codon:yes stop_codon:yes gene_type:complete
MSQLTLHHIALCVDDLTVAIDWYSSKLQAVTLYQDDTWALMEVNGTRIAFVIPSQHPPHIAFECDEAEKYGPLTGHRDGTSSVYVEDPFGNTVEILKSVKSI